jgi:hypothetical protein
LALTRARIRAAFNDSRLDAAARKFRAAAAPARVDVASTSDIRTICVARV